MNARRASPGILALAVLGALAISIPGCGRKEGGILLPNQRPSVRLTSAPYNETTRYYYSITLNWVGFDPDGRIDHYMFVIDPPKTAGSDTVWEVTAANQLTRSFPSTLPDTPDGKKKRGYDYHTFVVKSVDNRGAISAPDYRSFNSSTLAPTVNVDTPRPSTQQRQYVTPAVLIRWHGEDLDGVFTKRPVKYKYKLLTSTSEVPVAKAVTDPDSVRRYWAPLNWAGWDSTSADTTQKQYTNLTPDEQYIFVVIAFDEAGAYSQTFDLGSNMLWFQATFGGANLPRIGIYNEFFFYEYGNGVYLPNDPSREIPIEVPAGVTLEFKWFATAVTGSAIRSYRWAVDITDLRDETERTDENDLRHWSPKNKEVLSAILPRYPGGETHRFYLEAEDLNGLKALAVVRFTVVQSGLEKPLLVVNDTRFLTDEVQPGTIDCYNYLNRPKGAWPTSAELDTFLYARGGVPWRCYPATPTTAPSYFGGNSSRGIFYGYDFDTMGTRLQLQDMTIRLSTLGHYSHIVWLLDAVGAGKAKSGTDRSDPITVLRYMCGKGHSNTLAAYIRQGGMVWLAGGGAVSASLEPYNLSGGNDAGGKTYGGLAELGPGRFVYDQFHWRSEVKPRTGSYTIRKNLGFNKNPRSYSTALLPDFMQTKSQFNAPIDTFPPKRDYNPGDFYSTLFSVEILSQSNDIRENYSTTGGEDFRSTLDTLYEAFGSGLPTTNLCNPVMTYYHGLENGPLVVSGFSLWSFRKHQCKAVVDFVLQQLWNLQPVRAIVFDAAPASWPGAAGAARAWSPPPALRSGRGAAAAARE
jgi:hypothetical protein